MASETKTCRFKDCHYDHGKAIFPRHECVRVGKRHYMHADCFVRSGKPLSDLSKSQVEALPYFVLKECGRLSEVEAILGVNLP